MCSHVWLCFLKRISYANTNAWNYFAPTWKCCRDEQETAAKISKEIERAKNASKEHQRQSLAVKQIMLCNTLVAISNLFRVATTLSSNQYHRHKNFLRAKIP